MYPLLVDRPELGVQLLSSIAAIWAAIALCLWWAPRWAARHEGIPTAPARWALVLLAVVTLAGGRAHFVLNYPAVYAERWHAALIPWGGGFHIGGGMIAMAFVLPWLVRRLGMSAGKFADGIVVPLAVAVLVTRIGCLLHGCCFGSPCQGPWCVRFPARSAVLSLQRELEMVPPDATHSLPVHALAIYFGLAAVAVAAVAIWLRPRKRYDGEIALVALVLFSVTTAAIESLRASYGPNVYWAGYPQLQLTAIAMTVASLLALLLAEARHAWLRRRASARALVQV